MAVTGTTTANADGTIRFETQCSWCRQPVAVDRLDAGQFKAWQAGAFVQDAFPDMSASEREVLVSGTHAECWNQMFPPDEDDE